jgi:hypothetical protein
MSSCTVQQHLTDKHWQTGACMASCDLWLQVCITALHPLVISGNKLSPADGFSATVGMDSTYTQASASISSAFVDENARGAAFVYVQTSNGRILDVTGTSNLSSLDTNLISVPASAAQPEVQVCCMDLQPFCRIQKSLFICVDRQSAW